MKRKYVLSFILLFLLSLPITAQIPNAGFENWSNGSPADWVTNNVTSIMMLPVTQSTIAHSGSYAAKGEIVSFMTALVSPVLNANQGGAGFPISQRYATMSGYYKLIAQGGDRFAAVCILYKGSQMVAGGSGEFEAASDYTEFSVPLSYNENDESVPDNCFIELVIIGPSSDGDIHSGSYYLVDDLSLSGTATAVSDGKSTPHEFCLKQNYPNPFNPSTTISYALPKQSLVEVKIYDIMGNEIRSFTMNSQQAGYHNLIWNGKNMNNEQASSGTYIYRLKAVSLEDGKVFERSAKMMLVK